MEPERQVSIPLATAQEIDVNEHFARILHEDRMTEYRGDARASNRVTKAHRVTVKRRSSLLRVAAVAVTLALLVLGGVLILPPAA